LHLKLREYARGRLAYKVNWDVAINFINGKMGYGGIVRDFKGTVQAASWISVDFVAEPVVAESLACGTSHGGIL
jgi:hypothetical protein